MKRIIEEKDSKDLENIIRESLEHMGVNDFETKEVALLSRLFISGIARYFYIQPDSLIRMGFLELKKNPDKDELFAVSIKRSIEDGVVNADTLWKYYNGDLLREQTLKTLLDKFVGELLNYSQLQEMDINKVTKRIHMRKAVKEKENNEKKLKNTKEKSVSTKKKKKGGKRNGI